VTLSPRQPFSPVPGLRRTLPTTFVVHYAEIALKGKNRPEFVRILRRNIRNALSGMQVDLESRDGRILAQVGGTPEAVTRRLSKVFGVAWYAEAAAVKEDYGEIQKTVLEVALNPPKSSFKVDVRRSDKSFPFTSNQLASRLGGEVVERTGRAVDLHEPDLTIHVDVIRGSALVYRVKTRGLGGLPVGSAGRVIHLFSGGIDSPVAAWLMMKRGSMPLYLHFYLAPTVETVLESKISKLVKTLSPYAGKSTLVLVPFVEYQLATLGAPDDLEPSLFRRFMRMTAEAISTPFGASGISTGDSLSQTASQTIWNLGSFDEGSSLPVLRPLLTYDKEEIIAMARQIGTYEQSLEAYKDCCAIISRHPRTRVKPGAISALSKDFAFRDLVWRVLEKGTTVSYDPASGVLKGAPLKEQLKRGLPSQDPAAVDGPVSLRTERASRQNYKQAP
jgi:tRNA uracil 4-sulfurtransferase